MFEWININDKLPPNNVYVLVCDHHFKSQMNFVSIYKRFNEKWIDDHNEEELDYKKYCITHWMPLPDEPSKRITREEKDDILDTAWVAMTEHIKATVKEVMSKEEIAAEIWMAISEGVKDFLMIVDVDVFEKFMSEAFKEKFKELEFTCTQRKELKTR